MLRPSQLVKLIFSSVAVIAVAGCGNANQSETTVIAINKPPEKRSPATQLVDKAIQRWREKWGEFETTSLDIHDFGVVGGDFPNRKRIIVIFYTWKTKSRVPNFRGNWRLLVFDQHETFIGFSSVYVLDVTKSRREGDQLLLFSEDGQRVSIRIKKGGILVTPDSSFVGPMHSPDS